MEYNIVYENENSGEIETVLQDAENNRSPSVTDEKKTWSYDETLQLISSVGSHYQELNHPGLRKHGWINISNDLVSQNLAVSPTACYRKWQNLVRTYKVCKDNKKKTGRGPIRFNFFDPLDNILGDKFHFPSPPHAGENKIRPESYLQIAINEKHSDRAAVQPSTTGEESVLSEPDVKSEPEQRKRKVRLTVTKILMKEMKMEWNIRRIEKMQRHKEKMELMRKKLEIEERKAKALEEIARLRESN